MRYMSLIVKVLTPGEYQVVQRNASDQGIVPVRIECDQQLTGAEARLTLMPGYKGVDTDWTALVASDEPDVYAGNLTAVAGGWYELQVRAQPAEGGPLTATVPHIGIGEVFICAGQSNAANYGESPQQPADARVAAYHADVWRRGYDPQPGATGEAGSPWPCLGDMLARHLQMPIGFASVAIGGFTSSIWLPGAEGYQKLATVLQELGKGGARAVLWHQGEGDAGEGTTAQQYCENLATTIRQLSQDIGWCPPWVVAGVSAVQEYPRAVTPPVLAGQQRLWKQAIALEGPLTDDLAGPQFRYDGTHFNDFGLRAHAERWFAMLWAQFYADRPLVARSGD